MLTQLILNHQALASYELVCLTIFTYINTITMKILIRLRYLSFFAILFTLLACNNSGDHKLTKLPVELQLVCNPLADFQLITRFPAFIEQYHGGIIIFNPFEENGIFSVYNEKTGKLAFSYGQRGKGPDEFFTPMINRWIRMNNELIVYDPNFLLFYVLEFTDTNVHKKSEIALPAEANLYESIIMLHQNLFAGISFNHHGKIELFNKKLSILSTASYKPVKTPVDFVPSTILAYDEETGLLLAAAIDFGYLAAYEINATEPAISPKWEIYISDVVLTNIDNKLILDETKCLAGFTQLIFSEGKIFALYKGKEINKYYGRSKDALPGKLLVFDINGEIISNFSLECPLIRFSVSESTNQLVGITLEENFKLVYFDLP